VLDAPLGGPWSTPPAGGAFPAPLPGLSGIPTDGGFGTVDASSHNARADSLNEFMFGGGPVRRFVASPRPGGMYADSALPGGTSERLGSPYYVNLLPRWLTNDTYPVRLRYDDLARATASVTTFLPG
jgi:penicillin amidase